MPNTETTRPGHTRAGIIKRLLLGRRLASEEAGHQLLRKTLALPVFASDALSSVSYATEEMMLVLILAGPVLGQHLGLSMPLAGAVALLMIIVITSYRQTAKAYPHGGGAYIVSKENLGTIPGLVAGAALLVDYTLTVAVSIAAGSFAIASLAPSMLDHRLGLSIGFIVLVTIANLRGSKESGSLFAGPTYLFVAAILSTIFFGIYRCATDGCPTADIPHAVPDQLQALTPFIILRAFSSGATALTGVEAIVDGVPAFRGRRPADQARNAAFTLGVLGVIAVSMFLGLTYLANAIHAFPSHEKSLVAQIADSVWNGGPGFIAVQVLTAAILVLAANTAYQDFPRLASILAKDRYLPRQFINRGDRLVFSNGIVALALGAAGLIYLYDAEITRLIQLYVLGVFTSFTLSQVGMVVRWRRIRNPGWRRRAILNGIGGATTGLVFVIVAISKFTHGAYLVMIAVPTLVGIFQIIHRHYMSVGRQLRLPEERPSVIEGTHVLVAVSGIDESVYEALAYARAMRPRSLLALTVGEESSDLMRKWAAADLPVPLQVIEGSADDPADALTAYVRSMELGPHEVATVVLPEEYERPGFIEVLKRRRALRIKTSLLFEPRVAVTDVPVLKTGRELSRLQAHERIISVVLVSAVHNATLRAIEYARSLSPTEVRAVMFNVEPDTTMRVVESWNKSVDGVPLEAVDSPYRAITKPLLTYVREIRREDPGAIVSVVLPEFVVKKMWQQLLHNQTALQIKRRLLFEEGVVVTSVPFHLN